ncbi:MAG: type II secretion system protein GspK [Candidatus Omnitrophica bacterium]|nr:type II secretion system protein GspK [Candidatus Omnitrophota bacterium]
MKRTENQKGVALIMVLAAIAVLTIITTDFMRITSVYTLGTINVHNELKAEYLSRSAVNLSRLLLAVQGVISREMRQFRMRPPPLWQFADYFVMSFNDPAALQMIGSVIGAPINEAKGFGNLEGEIQVTIVDEESKINLNVAAMGGIWQDILARQLSTLFSPQIYDPIFDESGSEGKKLSREKLIAAIIDYVDSDDIVYGSPGYPEASAYETDEDSPPVKNAPFDDIEELHNVKGVTDDFWAAFVEPEPEHPEARTLTVWGSGLININTADPLVMYAVLCSFASNPVIACSPENMQNIFSLIQYMMDVRSLLGVPFANTSRFVQNVGQGIEGIPGVALNTADVNKYLTVDSATFSIYATGKIGKSKKTMWVVVDTRGANAITGGNVLYWKVI